MKNIQTQNIIKVRRDSHDEIDNVAAEKISPIHSNQQVTNAPDPTDVAIKAAQEKMAERVASADLEVVTDQKSQDISLSDVRKCAYNGQAGSAFLFRELNRGRYCKDTTEDIWQAYRGPYWERDHRNEALAEGISRVQEKYIWALDELQTSKEKVNESHIKALNKAISSLNTLSYAKSVLELAACGVNGLGVCTDVWDSHPNLICCDNGVVDLRTGELLPGAPDLYLRRHTPIDYLGESKIPEKFLKFLKSLFRMPSSLPRREDFSGREEYEVALAIHEQLSAEYTDQIIDYIQRLLGYVLWGAVIEHLLFVLYGTGRNGKTVLVEIIKYVLGDYAAPIQSDLLLTRRGGARSGASPELIDLRGLLFVWASETNEGKQMDSAMIKMLVGGDMIVGRGLYARSFTRFIPSHTLILLTNFKPNASADDFALWERIVLIPFKVRFVDNPDPNNPAEAKINRRILDELKEEAPAILRWMVEGYQKYKKEGLTPPLAIQMETAEYRRDQDVLGHFIENACVLGEDHEVNSHAGDLYNKYQEWTAMWGHKPCSLRVFGERMKLRFHHKRHGGGQRYYGIRLKQDDE